MLLSSKDWESYIEVKIEDIKISKWSDYIPLKYKAKFAAQSYYRLEEFKIFCSKFLNINSLEFDLEHNLK